jgi:two-component system response regulator FlrC
MPDGNFQRGHGDRHGRLVAVDARSREMTDLAGRVAAADVTVMLTGESGVGKEVFARFIHARSARHAGPFVAINCAAIPEPMLEATLFGHEKGAFTGAVDARAGKFEQACGGTLLLDEITEMALGLQAKLLRVLQEREVERLGASQARCVDVRVIATSNRNLRDAVARGELREDLYYRLNVFPLHVPALRERPEDIVPLAECLLRRHVTCGQPPRLTPEACERLRRHGWPGNVRELENVMQRALVLHQGGCIDVQALHIDAEQPSAEQPNGGHGLCAALRNSEGEIIREALRAEAGQRKGAAERLGISPRTLRYRMARLREQGVAIP